MFRETLSKPCGNHPSRRLRRNQIAIAALAAAVFAFAQPLHAAEAGEHGLLDIPDYSTIGWVLGLFIVVLIILRQTAWKNVLTGLKAREERIRNDLSQAEAAHAKAEASLQEYNARLASAEQRVQELIAAAQADAERLAMQIRTRAQEEAEETRERAVREIETAKKQALSEIYEQAATLATDVAQKILRRNLNANDQRDLVRQSLEELQSVGN